MALHAHNVAELQPAPQICKLLKAVAVRALQAGVWCSKVSEWVPGCRAGQPPVCSTHRPGLAGRWHQCARAAGSGRRGRDACLCTQPLGCSPASQQPPSTAGPGPPLSCGTAGHKTPANKRPRGCRAFVVMQQAAMQRSITHDIRQPSPTSFLLTALRCVSCPTAVCKAAPPSVGWEHAAAACPPPLAA